MTSGAENEVRKRVRCPCCGYLTLSERGQYFICPVCFWEDSGQDDQDADRRGGPNGWLSLTEARQNFRRIGACEQRHVQHVRPPRDDERPPGRDELS